MNTQPMDSMPHGPFAGGGLVAGGAGRALLRKASERMKNDEGVGSQNENLNPNPSSAPG